MPMKTFTRWVVLGALLFGVACDGGPSMAVADLAAMDLSVEGTPCGAVLTCLASTTDPSARTACIEAGSAAAKTRLEALLACGYGGCIVPGDAGAALCDANLATSTPSAECRQCVFAYAQSAACSLQFNACLMN